jgi:hypothetical protein
MAKNRSVTLKGCPQVTEEYTASATVKPGYLVDGFDTVAHQGTAAADTPRRFALERDELGAGVDNTYQGSGTPSAYYASGDVVKVGSFAPGMRVLAFVASGQDISVGEFLESAGDGTLRTLAAGKALAVALEAHSPNVVAADGAIAVEIM